MVIRPFKDQGVQLRMFVGHVYCTACNRWGECVDPKNGDSYTCTNLNCQCTGRILLWYRGNNKWILSGEAMKKKPPRTASALYEDLNDLLKKYGGHIAPNPLKKPIDPPIDPL